MKNRCSESLTFLMQVNETAFTRIIMKPNDTLKAKNTLVKAMCYITMCSFCNPVSIVTFLKG
jgi:hypothetical protein